MSAVTAALHRNVCQDRRRAPGSAPGSSHNPIVRHPPLNGVGSNHNPIVVPKNCSDPNVVCRRP